jgi:glyoxylase-like metal-dependent hydrolase (beta-lactamase superfamily II)
MAGAQEDMVLGPYAMVMRSRGMVMTMMVVMAVMVVAVMVIVQRVVVSHGAILAPWLAKAIAADQPWRMRFLTIAAMFFSGPALAATQLAPNTWLIPGSFAPGHQPDGNTVLWRGPDGLVVLDTGRHVAHSDAIIAFAQTAHAPVAAIVNSHWHLDHVSGNPRLKARWPRAKVYASGAIDGALGGFLAKSAAGARDMLAQNKVPPEMMEDVKGDLATIENGALLEPDVMVTASGTLKLAGRPLELHLTKGATLGDIWIYDPATHLVAAGDLVTLPVPFLDTADAQAWSVALGDIAATDFKLLVPGHGAPMTRAQFTQYRGAFGRFVTCAATQSRACGDGWLADTASLRAPEDEKQARGMIGYYVDLLRKKS